MLTDWERRQLAEIERGLAEDFAHEYRGQRLLEQWRILTIATFLCCITLLLFLGAWRDAIVLAVFCLGVAVFRRRPEGDF
jgi:Protein of unknown function (DUF3040)